MADWIIHSKLVQLVDRQTYLIVKLQHFFFYPYVCLPSIMVNKVHQHSSNTSLASHQAGIRWKILYSCYVTVFILQKHYLDKTWIFFQISNVLFQNLTVSDASIVSISKIYMTAILFLQTINNSAKLGCLLWQNIPIFACLESLAVHYTHKDIMISSVHYLSFRWLKD